ncbi:Mur ligase domain-containing protein [Streptomyces misionensis]|uniref:Mur ligase domain-containing protein n=1 Tax=Streptomyces misionensis TaxID=67331 RepID=UPI003816F0E8
MRPATRAHGCQRRRSSPRRRLFHGGNRSPYDHTGSVGRRAGRPEPGALRRCRRHRHAPGGAGCAERGFTVSGSDVRGTEALKALARLNVRVYTGHAAEHVPADATAVVFTHAIGPDNPEIRAARALGVPVVHRSTVLNALMATLVGSEHAGASGAGESVG